MRGIAVALAVGGTALWLGGPIWAGALGGMALVLGALLRGGVALDRPARRETMCDFSTRD
jgi:hypothetical protein